jgi:hypothetical protein
VLGFPKHRPPPPLQPTSRRRRSPPPGAAAATAHRRHRRHRRSPPRRCRRCPPHPRTALKEPTPALTRSTAILRSLPNRRRQQHDEDAEALPSSVGQHVSHLLAPPFPILGLWLLVSADDGRAARSHEQEQRIRQQRGGVRKSSQFKVSFLDPLGVCSQAVLWHIYVNR